MTGRRTGVLARASANFCVEEIPVSGIGDFPLLVSPRHTECEDGTEARAACHWEQGIEGKDDNISERSRGHLAFPRR